VGPLIRILSSSVLSPSVPLPQLPVFEISSRESRKSISRFARRIATGISVLRLIATTFPFSLIVEDVPSAP
jgi:hypothetical protein